MLKLEAKIGDKNPKTVTVAIFDNLSALKKNISISVPTNILKKCHLKILVLIFVEISLRNEFEKMCFKCKFTLTLFLFKKLI